MTMMVMLVASWACRLQPPCVRITRQAALVMVCMGSAASTRAGTTRSSAPKRARSITERMQTRTANTQSATSASMTASTHAGAHTMTVAALAAAAATIPPTQAPVHRIHRKVSLSSLQADSGIEDQGLEADSKRVCRLTGVSITLAVARGRGTTDSRMRCRHWLQRDMTWKACSRIVDRQAE